jgi:hypothetical protein
MLRKLGRIEPQVNVSFLPVHSSRNFVLQVELSESKLTQEIQCVQCDRRDTNTVGFHRRRFYRIGIRCNAL